MRDFGCYRSEALWLSLRSVHSKIPINFMENKINELLYLYAVCSVHVQ